MDWKNADHNNIAIKPMQNLAKMFIDVITNDYNYKRLTNTTITVRPRFGVDKANKGSNKNIISEDLSGVEFAPTLEVFNLDECNC